MATGGSRAHFSFDFPFLKMDFSCKQTLSLKRKLVTGRKHIYKLKLKQNHFAEESHRGYPTVKSGKDMILQIKLSCYPLLSFPCDIYRGKDLQLLSKCVIVHPGLPANICNNLHCSTVSQLPQQETILICSFNARKKVYLQWIRDWHYQHFISLYTLK